MKQVLANLFHPPALPFNKIVADAVMASEPFSYSLPNTSWFSCILSIPILNIFNMFHDSTITTLWDFQSQAPLGEEISPRVHIIWWSLFLKLCSSKHNHSRKHLSVTKLSIPQNLMFEWEQLSFSKKERPNLLNLFSYVNLFVPGINIVNLLYTASSSSTSFLSPET